MPKRKQPKPWEIEPDQNLMNPQRVMDTIKASGTKGIRAEYTRLRDIMQKRIKRGGLNIRIPKLRDLKGPGDLSKEFARLNRLIASETTTAEGRRRIQIREIETLERHKFSGIDTSNIDAFNRFMQWYREKYTAELPEGRKQIYDSDSAVTVFREKSEKITPESTNAAISRMFNKYIRENTEEDVDDINREARNAKRREERYKKRKKRKENEE